jgi:biotin carboxyl carrier protein
MMTNLTRQLRELGMEHRLDEILNEIIQVRREFGYPVMATPYSQIVGVQAMENVVSGERYKKIPEETIKYALDYYGPPVVPIDRNVMDRIMNLPRTKEFLNWKPEGYLKSVEELRREIGPELSDDDLLLKILIPGRPLKKSETGNQARGPAAPAATVHATPNSADHPREFSVEVDGERFTVKISPLGSDAREATGAVVSQKPQKPREGAVLCDMAGLVISLDVRAGDRVREGDRVAMIEAMKMRRPIHSPRSGTVEEIMAHEGEVVEAEDVLMVVRQDG